jgi:C4-dicarboxylate-binding protein DctP
MLHRHFTELDHSFLGYMVVTNADFWSGLPPDVRETLEAVLAEVTAEVNTIAREQAESDRRKAEEEGQIQVLRPSPAQLEEWREAFIPVWQDFEPQIGKAIIDAAQAARK